jgi:hypothetical protein
MNVQNCTIFSCKVYIEGLSQEIYFEIGLYQLRIIKLENDQLEDDKKEAVHVMLKKHQSIKRPNRELSRYYKI